MTISRKIVTTTLIVLIGLGVYFYYLNSQNKNRGVEEVNNSDIEKVASNTTYESSRYKFSFKYPSIYKIKESASPEYMEIMSGGGDVKTIVTVAYSDKRNDDMTYKEFVSISAKRSCEPDFGVLDFSCEKTLSEVFVADSGIKGEKFFIKKIVEGKLVQTFGPYYAFNISASNDDPDAKYTVLIIENESDEQTTQIISSTVDLQ